MKQEFEMSEEQLQAIYDISRNQTSVIYVITWPGQDSKQDIANKLWKAMADEMGFVWDSVEACARGKKFFLAEPKPIVMPKTSAELEVEKYVGDLPKIIKQIEMSDYECEGGFLKNNVAFIALKQMAEKELMITQCKR